MPLAVLLPFDTLPYQSLVLNRPEKLETGGGRSVLVNLWASWCAPCVAELAELRERADELKAAGVDVLALTVDGLGDARANPMKASKMIRGFPFESGRAVPELLERFQELHDAQFKLDLVLGVPMSFLIDDAGRLAVIYKGPVSVDEILEDVHHSRGSRSERLARAAALPGTVIDHPVARDSAQRAETRNAHAGRDRAPAPAAPRGSRRPLPRDGRPPIRRAGPRS